jgi:tetratricopeptide (TPR) repeat protein
VHLKAARWDEAIADYDKALALTPANAEVLYGRGLAKRSKGDAAGADLAAAQQAKPDIAQAFAALGVKP